MTKKKKHIFLKLCLFSLGLVVVFALSMGFAFLNLTKSTKLDVAALTENYSHGQFIVTSADQKEMDTSSLFVSSEVKIAEVPNHVKNAFVAIEDKRFYTHHGIDLRRMASATIQNIKNRKFSQGASTISQQLIKNTHLSREKTLKRKAKEIKLSLELEKKFSKDEILEMYLNNIYFGNGCYGIEKASKFYFQKDVNELDLAEGATLAGIINAPSYYDPISHEERAQNRRNVVLKCMQKNGYITADDYGKNAKLPISIVKNSSKTANCSIKVVLSEAAKALNVNENQLKNMRVKIATTLDSSIENILSSAIKVVDNIGEEKAPAAAIMVVDNRTKKIVGMASNTRFNLLSLRRQPGSTIKPIIAYAPALDSGLVYPDSIIVDEPISIDGYSPSNYNGKFSGDVSLRVALEKSLNIPAVKLLSKVGVNNGKVFAEKLGLKFSTADQNLALALGGMTDGLTMQELADAYSVFASSGNFARSSLIESITTESGQVLYKSNVNQSKVINSDTCYLVTDMLKGAVKNGTARRLSSLDLPIAAKTGTVGIAGSSYNSDAYSVCYTTDYTIVSWIGALDGQKLDKSINGASYPTIMSRQVLEGVYANSSPADFARPSDVVELPIDTRKLPLGKVELASDLTSTKFKRPSLFSTRHLPKVSEEVAESVKLSVIMEDGQKPTLSFDTRTGGLYYLYRSELGKNNFKLLSEFAGEQNISFVDQSASSHEMYEYFVLSKFGQSQAKSNVIKLKVG